MNKQEQKDSIEELDILFDNLKSSKDIISVLNKIEYLEQRINHLEQEIYYLKNPAYKITTTTSPTYYNTGTGTNFGGYGGTLGIINAIKQDTSDKPF